MPDTIGRVECLNVGDDFAFVGIRENVTSDFEAFIVWFGPSPATATLRLMHSHWFAMLGEAMRTGDPVRVTHAANSANITALRVDKATT